MTFTDQELDLARQVARGALRLFVDRMGRLPNDRETDMLADLSISAAHRRLAPNAPTDALQ